MKLAVMPHSASRSRVQTHTNSGTTYVSGNIMVSNTTRRTKAHSATSAADTANDTMREGGGGK
jgi:hypothetical protein